MEENYPLYIELRILFKDIYLRNLLWGSEGKLTEREKTLFTLGYNKGVEYMDIRQPLTKEAV